MSTAQTEVSDQRTASQNSYNEVLYPGGAFPGTFPCHLAMVAKMCGLNPPSPRTARVLELGCSMGSNILPMAASLPDAEFVGIDYAEKQIEIGKTAVELSQLDNVELRCASILDVDASYGKFDYIICHGVYSWVPEEVRDKILQIGHDNLTEHGVMYNSYNVFPGWHLKGLMRDMMLYHTAQFKSPGEKVGQARGLLDFLSKYAKTHSKAYTELLKEEAESLGARLDSYLYHEHLEEYNEPLYFHQFVDKVHSAGLSYLADTALHTMMAQRFDEEAAEMLRNAPLLRREQYMDFLRGRAFRASLLCHPTQHPNYEITTDRLSDLHVSLRQGLARRPLADGQTEWANSLGSFTSSEPVTSVFERINTAFPNWVPVEELLSNEQNIPDKEQTVLDVLMLSFVRGLLELSFLPPKMAEQVSDKPVAALYTRMRASKGKTVPSLRHNEVHLQPQQCWILQRLDGTQDESSLSTGLHQEIENGRFKVTTQGTPRTPTKEECQNIVKDELSRLRLIGLLVE